MASEAEAKTKWCPFARPGAVQPADCGEVRGNRNMDGSVDPGSRCIGSACMAWRWKHVDTTVDHHPMMAVYPPPKRTYERTEDGYCGLAGAAQ